MKKKGLIVATIVMVLVLATSITTATYAWFTTSNITSIDGFAIQVSAGNAVNIGLKADNTYNASASADSFVSGIVTWNSSNSDGVIGSAAGTWSGDPSLASTIVHGIRFGNVSKAVGFTTATSESSATIENTFGFAPVSSTWSGYTNTGKIVAATKGDGQSITSATLAKCNLSSDGTSSDFAYLFLGAMPTQSLSEPNELIIAVESSGGGTTLGIASAIHVAYRLNGASEWTDIDVFGDSHYTTLRTSVTLPLDANEAAGYDSANTGATAVAGAAATKITLAADDIGELDQIELIIYLAGWDSDCIDAAKGATGDVKIFFDAKTVQTANP